jgi:chromosome segregation ATPase
MTEQEQLKALQGQVEALKTQVRKQTDEMSKLTEETKTLKAALKAKNETEDDDDDDYVLLVPVELKISDLKHDPDRRREFDKFKEKLDAVEKKYRESKQEKSDGATYREGFEKLAEEAKATKVPDDELPDPAFLLEIEQRRSGVPNP